MITSLRLISGRPKGYNYLITCEASHWWGLWKSERQYIGDCTVWDTYPDYRHVSTGWQGVLYQFQKLAQHQRREAKRAAREAGVQKVDLVRADDGVVHIKYRNDRA